MDSGGEGQHPATTAEEEALKRNTDCVYFLASPLTCKKGDECEYRHSEAARLNPRDCYYWLKSNCLNSKCAFRHPPLDGLIGDSNSGPVPPIILNGGAMHIPTASTAYSLNKQSRHEPCIFFQKGNCLKGERCPFSHRPQANGTANQQQAVNGLPSPPMQPQISLKESRCIKQSEDQQNIQKVSTSVAVGAPPFLEKHVMKVESSSYVSSHARNLVPHQLNSRLPRSQPAHSLADAPEMSSNTWNRIQNRQSSSLNDHLQNGVEPGEIIEDRSSFDPHIADNVEGRDYFHDRDDFGRKFVQSGRKHDSNIMSDHRPSNSKPRLMYERNKYSGSTYEFDRNERVHHYHDKKPQRNLPEKSSDRSLLPERRVQQRHRASPDGVDRSDLRYRLKQRKLDGSRSAVGPDHRELYRRDDSYMEDKFRVQHSRKDEMLAQALESSVSSRLRGRITLPGTPSGAFETGRNELRHQDRLSPTRRVDNQDKKRKLTEDSLSSTDSRNQGKLIKGEEVESLNFTGPKSLAELRGTKLVHDSHKQSVIISEVISQPQSNVAAGKGISCNEPQYSSAFEGPKPLSLLLKKKKGEAPTNGANSNNAEVNNQNAGIHKFVPVVTKEAHHASVTELDNEEICVAAEEVDLPPLTENKSVYDGPRSAEDDHKEDESVYEDEHSAEDDKEDESLYKDQLSTKEDVLGTDGTEDYMEVDGVEVQELENFEQRDGDSYYEATETGDVKSEYESEVEEEDDLDDEEDFARRVGLILS